MKTRIAVVGAGLLLTLGSAVAGSLMYGQGRAEVTVAPAIESMTQEQVTPEMIASWKFSSKSSDYIAPRRPI